MTLCHDARLAGMGFVALVLTACGGATPAPAAPETAVVGMDVVTPVKAPAEKAPAGESGERRKGEEGAMGKPDPHIDPQAALRDAAEYGIIGLLNAGDVGGVIGGLVGANNDKGLAAGGLGLSGIGTGSGGSGQGIGLGSIGTIGHGSGGTGWGYGSGGFNGGGIGGAAASTSATAILELGDAVTLGLTLDQAVRALRGRAFSLRECYETALRKGPMEGSVALRLVVGRRANIDYVREIRSDLGSKEVAACIAKTLKDTFVGQPSNGLFGVIEVEMSFRPAPKR